MNEPLWMDVTLPHFPKLSGKPGQKLQFDAVVVGGGITGLMSAYFLLKGGLKVCLVERDHLAAGDTGSTTAHLTAVSDTRLKDLVKGFGKEKARLVWEAGVFATDLIEKVAKENGIECEFRRVPGYLHASLDASNQGAEEAESLKKEAELALELGIQARFLDSVPIAHRPGICFSNQAKFHPMKFIVGLAQAIVKEGGVIFEKTNVDKVDSDPLVLHCGSETLQSKHLVIATNVPIIGDQNLLSATLFQTKISSYSSYVIGATLPKGSVEEISLWDTSDPYFYLRTDRRKGGLYAIFGGKDHKTGQAEQTQNAYEELESRLAALIPGAKPDTRWSGQVVETHDGLPLIGEVTANQFIATGYCGNGFTFGTLAGVMAHDWVLHRKNPWAELFSPQRIEIHSGGLWNFIKENADYPRYMICDWLSPVETGDPKSVETGDGKVLKVEGKRVACARDEKGKLHTVSAVCTHMGCLVHWNGAEKTWDCPCHGSRFSCDGSVLAGPAESPLEKWAAPKLQPAVDKE